MDLHKFSGAAFLFTFFLSCVALANTQPTREDFINAARERYGVSGPNKETIDGLREEVTEFNRKAPIPFGNDVFMTSASVTERGQMIIRVTTKSATRYQVNPELIKNSLVQLACSDKSISKGFEVGLGASMLLTTVDGLDIDTGVINKSKCSQYK